MSELRDREIALLLDVSSAGNSARACHLVDEFIANLSAHPAGTLVDLNAGDLLLTRGVLTKIKHQLEKAGAVLGTVYAAIPQTQQAALDEGFYVKERLKVEWRPLRSPLPTAKSAPATPPPPPQIHSTPAVDLPRFGAAPAEVPEFKPAEPLPVEESVPAVAQEEIPQAPMQEVLPSAEAGFETLYLKQTLRSGQFVRFNGNVIIVGDVHAGSEVIASGDIMVWGELRGIAHAGAQGNYQAEIRAMKIEALQLRIADYIARRPDRIYYHKDAADSALLPELARVADGEIKVFKQLLGKTDRM